MVIRRVGLVGPVRRHAPVPVAVGSPKHRGEQRPLLETAHGWPEGVTEDAPVREG